MIASRCMIAVMFLASGPLLSAAGDPKDSKASKQSPFSCVSPPALPYPPPTVPADTISPRQEDFDCFSWKEFIALNWQADPASPGNPNPTAKPAQFGMRNDTSPVVWETYKDVDDVFQTDAAPPAVWGAPLGPKKLSSYLQAGSHAWLTTQSKHFTFYEIRLNEDEFNYIVNNRLYDAAIQRTFAQSKGITLPDGSDKSASYGKVGAIEIKAAWIPLDDQRDWPRYKTSKALVTDPSSKKQQEVVVGLVGLHIIHKTQFAQQFAWATFEHVDNAPSIADLEHPESLKKRYTYYNPKCDPASDPYKCEPNHNPNPSGHDPTPPVSTAPIQVVRENPIATKSSNNIVALNQQVWATIAAQNPKSVFLNYQLVNVQWPTDNHALTGPTRIPLTEGNPAPTPGHVTNTTLETYFQTTLSCLDCHSNASVSSHAGPGAPTRAVLDFALNPNGKMILKPQPPASTQPFATDYSFVFERAVTGPAPK